VHRRNHVVEFIEDRIIQIHPPVDEDVAFDARKDVNRRFSRLIERSDFFDLPGEALFVQSVCLE
jgi:hypothetical protein